MDPDALRWASFDFEQSLTVTALMMSIGNAATLANWMVSGLLDRHPKLKIGLIESGVGWVPFALEMLEHQFDETLPKRAAKMERRPWEYFRQNFWVTYWFETLAPQKFLDVLGVDRVLFETDYPHPTSLYPGVQQHLVETLGGHDYAVRKRVLQSNAVELYNLPF
jgi:predicted TIM-barrel fold metal-dependent hydrolase